MMAWPCTFLDQQFRLTEISLNKLVYKRHVGLYAYRVKTLHDFVAWPQSELEQAEMLEQLRFMANGIKIHMAQAREQIPAGRRY